MNGASAINGDVDEYAEHFDEGHEPHKHGVHQRIRANSTIMQMKKILGAVPPISTQSPSPSNMMVADSQYPLCSCQQRRNP